MTALLALGFSGECVCHASSSRTEVFGSPKKEYVTVVYGVYLHCANCVKKVKENISYEKGVKNLEVSLEGQTVTVTFDPSKTDEKKIAAAIRKLGYETKLKN
ncbi:MAG: heavy-metal-associated domain-containing protein [Candidatus Cryptobacteroides sp.]